jgi:ABC-type transport system substrate-binding protein
MPGFPSLLATAACAAAALAIAVPEAAAQADPAKVLHVEFRTAETGFDPQASSDVYSGAVNRAIFEPPLAYDYLARPAKLVPLTAAALPAISDDGLTWTFRIRPGIYFADDPAFKGRRRELTAYDYVYAWKRVLDPRTRSPALSTFDGKFVGADAAVAKAKATGRLDYDAPIEGLQAVDRYTIRIRLAHPAYDFLADFATTPAAAVAREVIEAYGDGSGWAMANPVGTGPYRLKEWRRGQRIVLEANPGFREMRYPESNAPEDRAIMAKLRGKRIPLIGRVEITIIEESSPRLLAFEKGDLDYLSPVPADLIWNVLDKDNKPTARFAKAGVTIGRGIQPSIVYTYFNMEDPIVGGYAREKIALRRAIAMAYNTDEEIRVLRQGQAEVATQVIPPPVNGHDPTFKGIVKHDPAGAKALLDRFGYVDRDGDGWRDLPDGRPLVLQFANAPTALDRQYNELWQRSMNAVGLKIEFVVQKWPDLLKMARANQLMIWMLANTSTTPEGYGFLGMLYGPHAGASNLSRFRLPEFDALYKQGERLPDGPEKNRLMRQMSELVAAWAPWKLNAYRYENVAVYPWLIGYKYNGFHPHPWQYFDLDLTMKRVPVQP